MACRRRILDRLRVVRVFVLTVVALLVLSSCDPGFRGG